LNVRGIIWIEEFVEKLVRKHGVARDEVREVLRDRKTKYRFVE
jgi:hypothetical protein